MEIIFAAAHLPASRGRQAGQKTSYYICEYLARRHNVHLLVLAPENEIADLDRDDLKIFSSSAWLPVSNRARLLGALSAPHLPLVIAARHSSKYRSQLRRLADTISADAVIFDHTAMFQYAVDVPSSTVTVGSAHDVYTQAWQRKAACAGSPPSRLLLGAEARRMQSWEKKTCAALDLVVVQNEKDKHVLEQLVPEANVLVIEPWTSPVECEAASPREPGSMIFWGAMDRAENVDAARWAAQEILPRVRQRVPRAKLYIAGSRGERLAPEFAGREDIVITGFVEDVGALMSRMAVALLPLRLGAGIKVKTLECMSAGLPVVTTSVGAEGIGGDDGLHYLIAESAEDLARHAAHLLCNPEEARSIGTNAQALMARQRDFFGRLANLEQQLARAAKSTEAVPSAAV